MKKLFAVAIISSFGFSVMAQQSDAPVSVEAPLTCFEKWEQLFSERGANSVEDGTHNNIIISVRNGVEADCYVGKAVVREGVVKSIYAMVEGGSHEIFIRKYQHATPQTVYNGISKARITVDDELVNVLFIENLKPKQRELVRAPDPQLD